MYPTKEIADGGPEPGTPTVAALRESQRKGSVGIGLADKSMADSQADFGLGGGEPDHVGEAVSLPWLTGKV